MSTTYFIYNSPSILDKTAVQTITTGNRTSILLPEVNLPYYASNGLFEKEVIDWCREFCRPDGVFLDIGGHTGTYAINLAPYCKEVHVFEPQRATYNALCGGIALSNLSHKVYAHRFGLGSPGQVGTQTLNIVSNDGGGSSLHGGDENRVLKKEEVEIRTLDSLGLSDISFIKMDVEENELFVLQGAKETLLRSGWPRIMFESNGYNKPLFDYLSGELGYQVFPITGWPNLYLANH